MLFLFRTLVWVWKDYLMTWAQESDIGRIQIELTNYCNAACPQCERFHLKELSEIRPEDRWEENANFDLSLNDTYIS